MMKWEYCSLIGWSGKGHTDSPYLLFYTSKEMVIENLSDGNQTLGPAFFVHQRDKEKLRQLRGRKEDGLKEWQRVSSRIAELGRDGWEMVSHDGAITIFKRPISN